MKFATIDDSANGHLGVLVGPDEMIDLALLRAIVPRAGLVPRTLRGLLDAGADAIELVRRCIGDADSLSAGERE